MPGRAPVKLRTTAGAARGSAVRTLAIDFGERRIGLAISDREGRLAVPLETVERTSDRQAAGRIAEIAEREGVERLVAGEPRGLDGRRGDAARRAAAFARRAARACRLPLELVDESLTSVEADERLREAGFGAEERRERIDAVAAQILLEEVLASEERRGGPRGGP